MAINWQGCGPSVMCLFRENKIHEIKDLETFRKIFQHQNFPLYGKVTFVEKILQECVSSLLNKQVTV